MEFNPVVISYFETREENRFKLSSGVIKFSAGNCLSGLNIVMKEP
jgi:hypothetical protein